MGVGGWVALRLNHAFALPFEANLLIAAVVTSVLGMLLAIPALRMRGLNLALVTLMVAGGLEVVFNRRSILRLMPLELPFQSLPHHPQPWLQHLTHGVAPRADPRRVADELSSRCATGPGPRLADLQESAATRAAQNLVSGLAMALILMENLARFWGLWG